MTMKLLVLPLLVHQCMSFVVRPPLRLVSKIAATPSKVVDEDGPTPDRPYVEPEIIDIKDIPEAHYDPDAHMIPHQPWRRGMIGDGCADPIEAEWRQEAEQLMKLAAKLVGGCVVDVTWFLTECVVTIDETILSEVDDYTVGPEIKVLAPSEGPTYIDEDDPNPEDVDLNAEEQTVFTQADLDEELKEEEEKEELKRKQERDRIFASSIPVQPTPDNYDDEFDPDDEEEEEPEELTKEELRRQQFIPTEEELIEKATAPEPYSERAQTVDTLAISTIANAILKALEEEEDRLDVLERHEIVLASQEPDPRILDTQTKFDLNRGKHVYVETHDPWGSNRTLRGKLVDRNSMDVYINKKGRIVTIPHNFVRVVRLVRQEREVEIEEDFDEYEEEEYEEGEYE